MTSALPMIVPRAVKKAMSAWHGKPDLAPMGAECVFVTQPGHSGADDGRKK